MCLYINHELTKKRLKDHVNKWMVYKQFIIRYTHDISSNTKLFPQFYFITTPIKLTSTGFYVSNRKSKSHEYEDYHDVVTCGIHVYTKKNRQLLLHSYEVALPCWGYKEDLVAFGEHEDAAFMKVQFIKEEVLEGLKDYIFPEHIPFIMQQLFPY